MKILVLDPRNGDLYSDLFIVDPVQGEVGKRGLGYVPVIHFDTAAQELIVVDTEADELNWACTKHWLKRYTADTLKLKGKREIPQRPMYAGYPGRSSDIASTPSGRYIYFLTSTPLINRPGIEDTFRVSVNRYDRAQDVMEPGRFVVESCTLAFGSQWNGDEDLYFHLSCDFPSIIAFGQFGSPIFDSVRLEEIPPRTHCLQETCGSWQERSSGELFCVTGEGRLYQVQSSTRKVVTIRKLPLTGSRCVPLHQLDGANGYLFVGVAVGEEERSFGLVSEIWQVSLSAAADVRVIPLPFPVINFVVTDDGKTLVGVNPQTRTLFLLDAASARTLKLVEDLGHSPAEVLLLP